jgi:hypothetical protein
VQPFHIECETVAVAGFHDGLRARVGDRAAQGSLISFHEGIHGRIFRETPDGQIHAALLWAMQSGELAGQSLDAVTRSAAEMIEASRLPHEAFATYLSVKTLPFKTEGRSLRQLAPEYVDYFRLLSELLDYHFTSSQLQFVVAWNAAMCIFSSPFLERIPALDWSEPVRLSEDEHPASRFEALLKAIRQSKLEGLRPRLEQAARTECLKRRARVWNIYSESAWMAATGSTLKKGQVALAVEEALAAPLRDWLQSLVPFTFLRGARLESAARRFGPTLRARLVPSWRRPFICSAEEGATAKPEELLRVRSVAAEASESRIINTNVHRLEVLRDLTAQTEFLLKGCSSIAIASACPPKRHLTHWSISAWPRGLPVDSKTFPPFSAEFDRADVVRFLTTWFALKMAGEPVPHLRGIVLGIQGKEDMARIIRETDYLPFLPYDLATKVCWYAWSGFLQSYDVGTDVRDKLLMAQMTANASPALMESKEKLLASIRSFEYEGLTLKLVNVGERLGTGLFMRAFPLPGAGAIANFELSLMESGKLDLMPPPMLAHFAPVADWAFNAVQTFWDEY